MPLGKTVSRTIKSDKDIKATYEIVKKVASKLNLKVKEDFTLDTSFIYEATEPMKWLSTNWPNRVRVETDLVNDQLILIVKSYSNGASITQDKNTNDFLNNFVSDLETYLSI